MTWQTRDTIISIQNATHGVLSLLKRWIYTLYIKLVEPRQTDEELHRKEIVCNTLLIFVLLLMMVLDVLVFKSFLYMGFEYAGINPFIMLTITGSIICLLYLSRIGYVSQVSHVMILILTAGCIYGQIIWGADLPSVILLWCFIITASSILISTRYSFFLALLIGGLTIFFELFGQYNLRVTDRTWKDLPFRLDDAIEYTVVFALIAGVSWLSNREIFKSLQQAKTSRRELQKERDQLEIKVEERTRELHSAQVEKINSMYQLVEFGRISSGLFHDLMTPLNTLSFSINTMSKSGEISEIEHVERQIGQCIKTSNRITDFISLAKKQIHHTGDESRFEICKEIENIVSLLQTKARQSQVDIMYSCQKRISIHGSPTMFSHIVTNLISNAIDSYSNRSGTFENHPDENTSDRQKVLIYTKKKHRHIEIQVRDFGSGIPLEIQSKIFDPFFTTKAQNGCGIGLSATKHSLEKYFKGSISFTSNISDTSLGGSKLRQGTTFIIKIPIMHNDLQSQSLHNQDNELDNTL